MSRMLFSSVALAILGILLLGSSSAADIKPHQEFAQKATWTQPTPASVREQALAWLTARDADAATRAQIEMLWASALAEGNDAHLLDLLAATFAAADPQSRELVTICSQPRRQIALVDVAWLADEKVPAWERNNLRLLYGRWLVQESLYDEALEQLAELKPEDVVDPAALLFYQAVVEHRSLNRDAGLKAITRLLENESSIARRYSSVARLMQADLEALKDESLDHIARRMDDIRRRLDLGRAGPKVRGVEDGVIASLDKLIEEVEKQQQAAAAAAAARGAARNAPPVASRARQHAHARTRAGRSGQKTHRELQRLGRVATAPTSGSLAADWQGFSGPLSRRHRTILP